MLITVFVLSSLFMLLGLFFHGIWQRLLIGLGCLGIWFVLELKREIMILRKNFRS